MATDSLHHLNVAARPEVALDNATRMINLRRDRWIDYPRAVQALEKLQWLFDTPERERMPCMVLHGESDIGKTQIIRKFQRQHPSTFDDKKGADRRDIIRDAERGRKHHARAESVSVVYSSGAAASGGGGVSFLGCGTARLCNCRAGRIRQSALPFHHDYCRSASGAASATGFRVATARGVGAAFHFRPDNRRKIPPGNTRSSNYR